MTSQPSRAPLKAPLASISAASDFWPPAVVRWLEPQFGIIRYWFWRGRAFTCSLKRLQFRASTYGTRLFCPIHCAMSSFCQAHKVLPLLEQCYGANWACVNVPNALNIWMNILYLNSLRFEFKLLKILMYSKWTNKCTSVRMQFLQRWLHCSERMLSRENILIKKKHCHEA